MIATENVTKWEEFDNAYGAATARMKVEGGYLYLVTTIHKNSDMCFVPDIDLTRYQAHLRDAYTQGYKDGQEDAKNGIVNPEEGTTVYI